MKQYSSSIEADNKENTSQISQLCTFFLLLSKMYLYDETQKKNFIYYIEFNYIQIYIIYY